MSVIAFGQKPFPAFFTADSGVAAPQSMNSVKELAETIRRLFFPSLFLLVLELPNSPLCVACFVLSAVDRHIQTRVTR